MSVRINHVKVGAAVAAAALTLAACTSGSSSPKTSSGAGTTASSSAAATTSAAAPTTSASAAPAAAADATVTPAATLRAGLTTLFRAHVNLTGFVVQEAVNTGLTSKSTAAAEAALDGNTVALGKAIGSLYGAPAQAAFLKMWRAHIGYFVTYTEGLATNNKTMVAKGKAELAGYQASFGKFLGTATGLPAAAVSADLAGHVTTLESAIQAIVTKSPTASGKLDMAAMHMDGTADVLAGGIAKQKKLAGAVDGPGSALRAGLTGLLQQHVADTVTVVTTAVGTSLTSPATVAAVKTLDGNTVALGKAIGSVYGPAAQAAFLKMWRAHIGYFVTYTKGMATGNKAMVATAKKELAGYQASFGKFLGGATGLPAAAVSADLQGHVTTLEAAIDAIVAKSPTAGAKVSMALDHMAGTAAVLASGIAKQKHLK